MEADKNIFPEIKIFDPMARLEKIARFVGSRLMLCEDERPNTGAAPMLDRMLEDQNPNQMRLFDEGF